jgi:hypothetical protein
MRRWVTGSDVARGDVGDDVALAEIGHVHDLVEDQRSAVDRRLHRMADQHVALVAESPGTNVMAIAATIARSRTDMSPRPAEVASARAREPMVADDRVITG